MPSWCPCSAGITVSLEESTQIQQNAEFVCAQRHMPLSHDTLLDAESLQALYCSNINLR